ncbi:DEAD/DEAH box helicase [Guyparkeria hydrothermalis]|uniref:DEAD/DEAH box helicase n=1 Tax=Guyparkeria hydrothermalis TaxID=923 RepID=UPI002021D4AB|nr:DEAD/DEAH box helicase [Guyparkeria hydrothermalis]MCL7744263.1 DEAD/DEAH box helicase [Guyparkeria hydrothermalis]
MDSQFETSEVRAVLNRLKPFQRDTVEYVFRRLYTDPDHVHRFLVADEVGLGKTMVARGVVAKAVEHLWDEVGRIDVVYICSNADIARQNLNRLNITKQRDFEHASRITLLPITRQDPAQKINFISFTPSTSLNLRSAMGIRQERELLFWLLKDDWSLPKISLLRVLQGTVNDWDQWREGVTGLGWQERAAGIDPAIRDRFLGTLTAYEDVVHLRSRLLALCMDPAFHDDEGNTTPHGDLPGSVRKEREVVIGELREQLARACVSALEPDLIILDEFQRFKDLLGDATDSSSLAGKLFDYANGDNRVRTLLLSATPYKMYTLHDERGEEDHYQDFLATLEFLENGEGKGESFSRLIENYRDAMYRLADGDDQALFAAKEALEAALRRYMVRTERLAIGEGADDMLKDVEGRQLRLSTPDVQRYVSLQKLSRILGGGDVTEYWKSGAYLLNFMEAYKFKEEFERSLEDSRKPSVVATLKASRNLLLSPSDIEAYRRLEPVNARIESLLEDVRESGVWRLLWMPPSAPYYELGGVFAQAADHSPTKRLIFSSWTVVPRVISALVSYEVERLIFQEFKDRPSNTSEARKRYGRLFDFERRDGRLTGMPALALLYPSFSLARLGDPLDVPHEKAGYRMPKEEFRALVRGRVEQALEPILEETSGESGQEDKRWYWATPVLLDQEDNGEAATAWLSRGGSEDGKALAQVWVGGDDDVESLPSSFPDHAEQLKNLLDNDGERELLGRPPADLIDVITDMALAAPGVTCLRSLSRVVGNGDGLASTETRDAAAKLSWGFRKLLNQPEAMALIRMFGGQQPYWRQVLRYSFDGGLQAVLDEFLHLLVESRGLRDASTETAGDEVADVARSGLELITSGSRWKAVEQTGSDITIDGDSRSLRTHFALRFGNEKREDGRDLREQHVRDAFNSPFWPFLLVTTSVGQEGLDFHPYCHAVMHWNLPANPVDMEQREGRVHRYKNHAVRKNIAAKYGDLLRDGAGDPWWRMFRAAEVDDAGSGRGLVPFWTYPLADGAHIERHVPRLPLSRDYQRLQMLKRSLAVYRMVFGQARQEDLVEYLWETLSHDEIDSLSQRLRISLLPPRCAESG